MKKYLQQAIEFYDKNADQYMEKTLDLQDLCWLDRFISYIEKGEKILDIGCGFGRDCRFFANHFFDVYGIDLSPAMIDRAKKYEPRGKYYVMDAEKLGFDDNYFGALWCSAVLYHFKKADMHQVLQELKRVLRVGGIFYLNLKEGRGQKFIKDTRYGKEKKLNSFYVEAEIKKILASEDLKLLDFEINVEPEDKYKNTGIIYIIARKK